MKLFASLTRYELAGYGSRAYERDFRARETRYSNVATRRTFCLGAPARIGVLFAVAGDLCLWQNPQFVSVALRLIVGSLLESEG